MKQNKENMLRNLKMYFPSVADTAVDYIYSDEEITVKLDDGTAVIYDDVEKTVRNLPVDSRHMTERQCRHEFGERLRKIMYKKGITQLELSEMTGISQVVLSKYITGKNTPSFFKVDIIAKALGCSVDDFRYFY